MGLEVKEGAVHVFPQGNTTEASLRAWLIAVRHGCDTPSSKLIIITYFFLSHL